MKENKKTKIQKEPGEAGIDGSSLVRPTALADLASHADALMAAHGAHVEP